MSKTTAEPFYHSSRPRKHVMSVIFRGAERETHHIHLRLGLDLFTEAELDLFTEAKLDISIYKDSIAIHKTKGRIKLKKLNVEMIERNINIAIQPSQDIDHN